MKNIIIIIEAKKEEIIDSLKSPDNRLGLCNAFMKTYPGYEDNSIIKQYFTYIMKQLDELGTIAPKKYFYHLSASEEISFTNENNTIEAPIHGGFYWEPRDLISRETWLDTTTNVFINQLKEE